MVREQYSGNEMQEDRKGRVIITGGSGLIGTELSHVLTLAGYDVAWLSCSGRQEGPYKTYPWDIAKGQLDETILEGVEALVHLAGAGVADKRWTPSRKKLILDSRRDSAALLVDKLKKVSDKPKVFVGASAIGYYGADRGDELLSESASYGHDFLATVVREWEGASQDIEAMGIRRVMLRVGIVLSRQGGALPEILAPLRWGLGAPLGSGDQWMSWIHMHDLCRMFLLAIENKSCGGIYNAVGPEPATNRMLTKAAAKVLKKPLWLPAVPAPVLKLILGEMAQIVLGGSKISPKKIEDLGFKFDFPKLEEALEDLLKNKQTS